MRIKKTFEKLADKVTELVYNKTFLAIVLVVAILVTLLVCAGRADAQQMRGLIIHVPAPNGTVYVDFTLTKYGIKKTPKYVTFTCLTAQCGQVKISCDSPDGWTEAFSAPALGPLSYSWGLLNTPLVISGRCGKFKLETTAIATTTQEVHAYAEY